MVATMSPAHGQYHHTVNTLKYADRAKEIRTHIQKNIGTADNHVSDYQSMINGLQVEVCRLKKELAEKESQLCVKPSEKSADDELSWLDILSRETSENVQERINLQKALFEIEETNLHNRIELQYLDAAIAKQQAVDKEGAIVEALGARRQVILDNIRDNDEAGVNYQKEIEANEKQRNQLQDMIEEATSNNGNKTYLRILSQYRILGMANTELQFEMARRDQIIHNQREEQRKLCNLLSGLGLNKDDLVDLAAKKGIVIESGTPHLVEQQLPIAFGKHILVGPFPLVGQSNRTCIFQQYQDCCTRSYSRGACDTLCREEHHSSYYTFSHDHIPSVNNGPGLPCTPDNRPRDLRSSCPEMKIWSLPCSDNGHHIKEAWGNHAKHILNAGHCVQTSDTQGLHNGRMTGHAETTQTFRGHSLSHHDLRTHNFQHIEPSNHPNISCMPSFPNVRQTANVPNFE